jgi:Asp-tRNA(Asn)/Glu-tRNA(Gln) amidotransferase A subunit family amidase
MSAEIIGLSLTEVRGRLRRGELTPAEVLHACMSLAHEKNSELRTFISLCDDSASNDAEAAVRAALPLAGVPLAVKDLIDVAGAPTTAASRLLAWAPAAERDAECVRRLQVAGAFIMGKTNLHEFAYGGSGAISIFGAARNPRDPSRVCGGSSSGSAAAVAAGMCYGALGTDTAGSIRLPAACCGVVGFKPTWGRVPVAGVLPLAWSYDHVGPLARTVEDAGELFAVLAAEPTAWAEPGPLRCGVAWKYFGAGLEPEVQAGYERALAAAQSLGWELHDIELEISEDRRVSNAESWAFHKGWATDHPELYDARTLPRIVNGKKVGVEEYIEARRALERLRERNRELPHGVDVVLTPTSPILPPAVEAFDGPESRTLELTMLRNTRPFNVLGWPAISLPAAPMVGVQLAAGWGADWALLNAARALERALG